MKIKNWLVAFLFTFVLHGVHGQGEIILQNNRTSLVVINDGVTIVAAPVKSGIYVQLFYQLDNGGAAPAAFTALSLGNWEAITTLAQIFPALGRFSAPVSTGADVYGPNNPSGNVWLEAVAFNNSATSFQAALNSSTLLGFSTVWSQGSGNYNASPPTAAVPIAQYFSGITMTVYNPVPETPSLWVLSLAVMSLLVVERLLKHRPVKKDFSIIH